jgi:hypothetical protein
VCVEILDAWREMRDPKLLCDFLFREGALPPDELLRKKRSHEAEVKSALKLPRRLRSRLGNQPRAAEVLEQLERQATERIEREKRLWAITLIDALPTALRRALALSVIVKIDRHWPDEEYRRTHARYVESALTAVAGPLFEESARRWRRNLRRHAGFVVESWLLAPGEEPTCAAWAGGGGAFVVLSLPLSWFIDVWARGIALVDGCFVLGVTDGRRDDGALRVVALRWERGSRETSKSVEAPALVSRGDDGKWVLHWV